jgi:hypothetical protein
MPDDIPVLRIANTVWKAGLLRIVIAMQMGRGAASCWAELNYAK